MKVLNLSTLPLNDSHNYYGGAIGNIAYNMLAALARLDGVCAQSFTPGFDLQSSPPRDLELLEVDSQEEVERRVSDVEITDDTVLTHLYFHEPEYAPMASFAGETDQPFVIGMCEPPHPRFRDEVSGIEKLPFVREIGKQLLYMPKFRRTLERCDRLVTVSEYGREYYDEYVPADDIEVVPYGVDADLFESAPLPGEHRILVVSRLVKRRGIDALVEALPDVAEDHPDVTLDLVGDGPRKDRLESLAADLGVRSRLTFHGNVPPETLVERYRQCYVFCHLSLADGWNQPALEAMASGRPIVATDEPHNSMLADGETGYMVPFDDPAALADRLDRLLSDRELAAEIGRTGRDRAETLYSWDRIAGQYRDIFRTELDDR